MRCVGRNHRLQHGYAAVASGSCDTCLTIRPVQRIGASGGTRQWPSDGLPGNEQFLGPFGDLTAAQWAGMYMQRHMHEFGTTAEQFGHFVLAQRDFAAANDDAIHRTPLTMDDYLADIHALVASADISIAAGRERGGLLVYFIGGVRSHISAYHLGLEPAELFVVIYSADRDRIITGYQFSTMTNLRMPGDCIWLRRLPPLA